MLSETFTDGFLVIQDGAVVTERYLDGMRETDTHLLMSCSKSLASILFGVLAGRGLLAPGDLVTRHLPELAGTAWEGCRLQHILDMRAGNAWDYDVDEFTILDVSDYRTHDLHGTIPRDTETWIRTIGRGEYGHGTGPFRYCSLATDVLGWVLERVGGAAFAGALLARGVVAHRRRAGRADHARRLGVPDRRGWHLHDAARPRALRAHVPRRRPGGRRAGRACRLDRTRARARRRADRGLSRPRPIPVPTSPTPSTTTSGG